MKNHNFGKSFHPHAYHQSFAAHGFADALRTRRHCWDLFVFDILWTTVHCFIVRCTALLPRIDKYHSDLFQKLQTANCLRLQDSLASQKENIDWSRSQKRASLFLRYHVFRFFAEEERNSYWDLWARWFWRQPAIPRSTILRTEISDIIAQAFSFIATARITSAYLASLLGNFQF